MAHRPPHPVAVRPRPTSVLALLAAVGCASAAPPPADAAGTTDAVTVCDATWHDAERDRDVPVRIRAPEGEGPLPLILFSHGLGGSLDAGTDWAEAWSAEGFAVIHLQHPGSDRSLWIDADRAVDRLAALRAGMSADELPARVGDVRFVLDEAARRTRQGACDLSRLDATRVGMSGHSFGAVTTQAVAGETFPRAPRISLRDPRIRAALALSPSAPNGTERAVAASFEEVEIPFFSVTGTEDEVPILTRQTPEQRTLPFRVMPPGQKYLLVFEGGTHADFGGSPGPDAGRWGLLRPGRAGRLGAGAARDDRTREHVHRVVIAATLAFWRATLVGDPDAREFLEGGGVTDMLAPGDRFDRK